ncbi:hypothetical protein HPB50_006960 [Hyalomma asiaticum]|uniref:Uncharacterized protein n=1 Tax=Hyalomma asiaticum TaxID=266040 RepID=A0ACB7TJM4_HYAAI|nr:hypothetical protein HPB50_006960 [Hyalomma asiaticum]
MEVTPASLAAESKNMESPIICHGSPTTPTTETQCGSGAVKSSLKSNFPDARRRVVGLSVRWIDQQPGALPLEYLVLERELQDKRLNQHATRQVSTGFLLNCPKVRTSLILTMIVLMGLVAVMVYAGQQSYREYIGRSGRSSSRLCQSHDCLRLSALLAGAMNSTADPCDNFYEYVCGKWDRSHSYTLTQGLHDSIVDLTAKRVRKVRVPEIHQSAYEKAARYFTACEDVVAASENHVNSVQKVLQKGGITLSSAGNRSDLLDAIFYMSQVVRVPVLLAPSYDADSSSIFMDNTMPMFNALEHHRQGKKKTAIEKFYRALYYSFHPVDSIRPGREFYRLGRQQKDLFLSLNESTKDAVKTVTTTSTIHRSTMLLSKRQWEAVFRKYWKIARYNTVRITVNKKYVRAVSKMYKNIGAPKFMHLYAWLCAQALFSFSSKRIISSFHDSSRPHFQHRTHCFHQTDYFMHYALQEDFSRYVVYHRIRDDVTRITSHVLNATKSAVAHMPSLYGNCSATKKQSVDLQDVFKKYKSSYVEDAYAMLPDMTDDPLTNWIRMSEATRAVLREGAPAEKLLFGQDARVRKSPLEPMHLELPWYALEVPYAVKIAGIGSRVADSIFLKLLSDGENCGRLQNAGEEIWECLVAQQPRSEELSNSREAIVVSLLSSSILWKVFSDSRTGPSTRLVHDWSLDERQLFFVVECLRLCGESDGEAKCNVPTQHNALFASAFSCPLGSAMRPDVRCAF